MMECNTVLMHEVVLIVPEFCDGESSLWMKVMECCYLVQLPCSWLLIWQARPFSLPSKKGLACQTT